MNRRLYFTTFLIVVVLFVPILHIQACPFCAAISNTLSQDLSETDVVAIGTFQRQLGGDADDFAVTLCFKVTEIVKGEGKISLGTEIKLLATEAMEKGDRAVLMGLSDGDFWQWWAIGPVSDKAIDHMKALPKLPTSGKDRLSYFLPLLTSEDKLLRDDAFNEFALASIADLYNLKPSLNRDQIIAVLKDPSNSKELLRLHWTLLSICGLPSDAQFVQERVAKQLKQSTDEIGLDSALSCMISLGGEPALAFIDEQILIKRKARYCDVNAAVLAIRVHGTELDRMPRERLLESFALLLHKPDLADLVIPDLARWQDWSHVDRLLKLYAEPVEKSQYLRVPVVRYLQACPHAEATTALNRCREIDPEAIRRAEFLSGG